MERSEEEDFDKYDYIEWDEQSKYLQQAIKKEFKYIEFMLNNLNLSRELSLSRSKLEESFMWIGKAIRSDQIERYKRHK